MSLYFSSLGISCCLNNEEQSTVDEETSCQALVCALQRMILYKLIHEIVACTGKVDIFESTMKL